MRNELKGTFKVQVIDSQRSGFKKGICSVGKTKHTYQYAPVVYVKCVQAKMPSRACMYAHTQMKDRPKHNALGWAVNA